MRPPSAAEVRQAIVEQADLMLQLPISNIGVKGIRKAAEAVPAWPQSMDADALKWALFNSYIFISPVGGSGGGNFRYMFTRFLREAAVLADNPRLDAAAADFAAVADAWAELGEWFHATSELPDPAARLDEAAAHLHALADREAAAWARLRESAA